jgi:hypothetical protein
MHYHIEHAQREQAAWRSPAGLREPPSDCRATAANSTGATTLIVLCAARSRLLPSRSNIADWPTAVIPHARVVLATILGPATAVSCRKSPGHPGCCSSHSFTGFPSSNHCPILPCVGCCARFILQQLPLTSLLAFLLARLYDKARLLDQATTCHISSTTVCARSLSSWSKPVNVCLCALWDPSLA